MIPSPRLSFNQITADPWSLEQVVHRCSQSGISYIAVWRHKLEGNVQKAAATIRAGGLRVSSLCRGGWFSAPTATERRQRIEDNLLAIEEAAILGAPILVIVSGPANGQSLEGARATVLDGLLEILPYAEKAGVKLGIEPLHPMYAAERSVVVTLKQANEIIHHLASPAAGVVIDAFHVWWDPDVFLQIEQARGTILGFHVSDWPVPFIDLLMGRAMMGEGVIELRKLRKAVDASGYDGPIEVEIFNKQLWKDADEYLLERIQQRFNECV